TNPTLIVFSGPDTSLFMMAPAQLPFGTAEGGGGSITWVAEVTNVSSTPPKVNLSPGLTVTRVPALAAASYLSKFAPGSMVAPWSRNRTTGTSPASVGAAM